MLEVLVPFWGDPSHLRAAVASVQAQTDPEWRLVVVDDHYPDPSVAQFFAGLHDERITYVRNDVNLGISANFERCRQLATGDLVVFLGCDDLLHPTYVERARSVLAAFPGAAILQPGVCVIDGSGSEARPLGDRVKDLLRPRVAAPTELSGEPLATSLLRGNWLYWPSLVFRRAWIAEREFRVDQDIVLDLSFVLGVVRDGGSLVLDPEVTFSYRRHAASLSSTAAVDGSRLAEEGRYFAEVAADLAQHGWPRAARAARQRWVSRLHALTLVPGALRNPARRESVRHIWAHVTR
ncbi:glycosyltransferase [Nocardioides sp. SYSU D00065]|uniref:glycosyltransferase family 2 protein n=1 Tax=Nocardioides sp. SYSU D00065 TaxID=2817378 RepID=UPI001B342E4A|nr:glycosyltransferase [Nocardioides sp. SYSU D00065]